MPSVLGFKFRTFNCIFILYFIGKLFTKNQNLAVEIDTFICL
jgi:hypothetical protein